MNQLEWSDIETLYQNEFGGPMRGKRWSRRFASLPYEMLERALYCYGEESNRRPTIHEVIRCLPKGAVKSLKPDHIHVWEDFPPAAGDGDVVICNTCGSHNRVRCRCRICQCRHPDRYRVSRRWYECPACNSAIIAKGDDPDVPF